MTLNHSPDVNCQLSNIESQGSEPSVFFIKISFKLHIYKPLLHM